MLTALLRREGHLVNHKRVLRLMRDNLLSLRGRSTCLRLIRRIPCRFTEPSRHVKLTGLNSCGWPTLPSSAFVTSSSTLR